MAFMIGFNPTAVLTSAEINAGKGHQLGTVTEGVDGKRYIFAKTTAATILQYAAVGISEDYVAQELTTALASDNYKIGIANVEFPAATSYGWFQIYGKTQVRHVTTVTADAVVKTTTTAGSVDSGTTAGVAIRGLVITAASTTAAGVSDCFMSTEPQAGGF